MIDWCKIERDFVLSQSWQQGLSSVCCLSICGIQGAHVLRDSIDCSQRAPTAQWGNNSSLLCFLCSNALEYNDLNLLLCFWNLIMVLQIQEKAGRQANALLQKKTYCGQTRLRWPCLAVQLSKLSLSPYLAPCRRKVRERKESSLEPCP